MKGSLILKNAIYLLVSNVFVRLISALSTIVVAKYLGAHNYGILSVALSFAAIAGYFSDSGLTHTLIREATRSNSNLSELMSSFLKIRIFFALITAFISVIIIEILYKDPYLQNVLYWMVMPTILGAALQGVGAVYFQVIEEMKYTALIRGVSGLITAISLILGILMKWSLLSLATVYGFSSMIGGLFGIWMVIRRINLTKGWNFSLLKGLGSFTFGGLMVMMLPQLGPLILEKVTDLKQVGYFSAAYRIPSVLYQIPGVLAAAFYPMLFKYGNNKQGGEHLKLSRLQIKLMSALGIIVALPFLIYSKWFIEILFGENWLVASNILSVLSIMVILQSINYPLADSLTTLGMQNRRSVVLTLAVIMGIGLYILMGELWGGMGGAIAAIATELFLTLGFTFGNPVGKKVIGGVKFNVLTLFIICGLSYFINNRLNPLIGIFALPIFYILLIVIFDRSLIKELIVWIKPKDNHNKEVDVRKKDLV